MDEHPIGRNAPKNTLRMSHFGGTISEAGESGEEVVHSKNSMILGRDLGMVKKAYTKVMHLVRVTLCYIRVLPSFGNALVDEVSGVIA